MADDPSMQRKVIGAIVLVVAALLTTPAAGSSTDRLADQEQGCSGLRSVPGVADPMCTHGGDPAPTGGLAVGRPVGPVASAPCVGNGRKGRRIRVFYGRPRGTEGHASTARPLIRSALALADANLDAATTAVAGQHYRFWCKTDTAVTVESILLEEIGVDGSFTFPDVIDSLQNQVALGLGEVNHGNQRFIYMVFVDNVACCYPYAGQGTMWLDDRADPAVNANNVGWGGPRYSMVRLGWPAVVEAGFFQHEVGHNLGAVQNSAPHTSGQGHCYENADVMCYADGGPWFAGGGGMVDVCPTMPDGQEAWDCGADDYYAESPAGGSYLSSHWNLRDSAWLAWDSG